ncbi:MAG: hypothetical protein AAF787_01410 [Chloroflexota bacterium]
MIDILEDIQRNVLTRKTSQYFINGNPGSGKVQIIEELAASASEYIPGCIVFGPIRFDMENPAHYARWIVDQFYDACFVDDDDDLQNDTTILESVAETWGWLSREVHAPNKTFVILMEMQGEQYSASKTLADFFSALRSLDTSQHQRRFNVHHVITGFWDHVSLESYYRSAGVSFPYTVGHNYTYWKGLSADEVINRLPHDWTSRELYGRVLHELTGGNEAIVSEAITCLEPEFRMAAMLNVIDELARDGQAAQQLLATWQQLPASALKMLTRLLLHRNVALSAGKLHQEMHLVALGLASLRNINGQNFLSFQSWTAELITRYHYQQLNIDDQRLTNLRVEDISPELQTVNTEAYRVIYDIETSARNLVVIVLASHQRESSALLEGYYGGTRGYHYNDTSADLQTRASAMHRKTAEKGLDNTINPLIAYITTGELAGLIEEVGREYNLHHFKDIGKAMKEVSDIRNAVMHNQLIDEKALAKLYDLQSGIHAAFSRIA